MGPREWARAVPFRLTVTVLSSPQLVNWGPSSISRGVLELSCPQRLEGQQLLYMTRFTGLSNCTSSHLPNPERLEVRPADGRAWGAQAERFGKGTGPGRAGRGCA